MKSKLLLIVVIGILLLGVLSVNAQEMIGTELELLPRWGGEGEPMMYDPNDPSVLFPEDLRGRECPRVTSLKDGVIVTGILCQGFDSPGSFKIAFTPDTPSGFFGRGCASSAAGIHSCGSKVITGNQSIAWAYGTGVFWGVWRMSSNINDTWLDFTY